MLKMGLVASNSGLTLRSEVRMRAPLFVAPRGEREEWLRPVTIGWIVHDSIREQLRVIVKRIMKSLQAYFVIFSSNENIKYCPFCFL